MTGKPLYRPVYINGMYRGERETVDEFETLKEAKAMLREYRSAFGPDWQLWISQRRCANWRDK